MPVKKYKGNKPHSNYYMIGSFDYLDNEWFVYKNKNEEKSMLIKIFANGLVDSKANYWLIWDEVFKESGKDYFIAKENNPLLLIHADNIIKQYMQTNPQLTRPRH